MSLKFKVLIASLCISIIPCILITSYTYRRYTALLKEQTTDVADNIFEKATETSNNTLNNIKHIAGIFNFYSTDTESVVEDLKKYTGTSADYTDYDVFNSNQKIRYICQNLIYFNDYINGIFIFTPNGTSLGYGYGSGIDIVPGYDPTQDDWYRNTLALEGGYYIDGITKKDFILNAEPSISFCQALYDVYTHEYLGMLFIDCSPNVFDLSTVNSLPNIALLALEYHDNCILYSNVDSLKTEIQPQKAHYQSADLDFDDMRLIFLVNYSDLYNQFDYMKQTILLISGLCIALAVIFSLIASAVFTKPIIELSQNMARITGKELVTSPRYLNRTDEIGILYNEYNQMIETMQQYIEKELQNRLITLDSQMKSLEAQINSHFLFNTLESINSIAEIEGVKSISVMSLALGNMFRYSIKTQSELVTVADEIKHVIDYVSIQRIRFDNKFSLEINIPPELYPVKVLKLILQPLVENSFYHGLKYCTHGTTIWLNGWVEQDNLFLSVSDDGVGIAKDYLEILKSSLNEPPEFTELGQRKKESIGVKNIHTRLVLYYGEGYGLSLESQEGHGTTAIIKLPFPKTEEE